MKCPGRNASLFALVSRRSCNLIAVGGGVVSERFIFLAALAAVGVAVASAAQTPEAAPGAQRGTVSEHRISSKVYRRERRVWVYMPPGYSSSAHASYDVLIVFDGREYLEDILFGNVLSQSGGRFVLEVGSRESARALGGAAPSILEANRKLRDVLRAKGYPVAYAEIPEGTHSTETWKERLPAALASLAGPPERPDAPGPTR